MIFHLVVLPTVLLHIPYAGCRVLVPLFALSFGVSPFTVGIIMSLLGLLPMMFAIGAGLGGAQPMIMTLLYAHAPAGRGGEAVGMRTVLINLSQTGMPLLFGALGAAFGMTPVFWAVTALLLACGYRLRKP